MSKLYSFGFCFGSENRLTFSVKNFVAEVFMAVALSEWLCRSLHCVRKVSTATHFQGERHA